MSDPDPPSTVPPRVKMPAPTPPSRSSASSPAASPGRGRGRGVRGRGRVMRGGRPSSQAQLRKPLPPVRDLPAQPRVPTRSPSSPHLDPRVVTPNEADGDKAVVTRKKSGGPLKPSVSVRVKPSKRPLSSIPKGTLKAPGAEGRGRPVSMLPAVGSVKPEYSEDVEEDERWAPMMLGENANEYVTHRFMVQVLMKGLKLEERDTNYFLGRLSESISGRPAPSLIMCRRDREFLDFMRGEIDGVLDENRKMAGIIRLQAVARGYLVRKRYFGMSRKDKVSIHKRNEAYRDLLNTEKQYIRNLLTLINMFMKPIRTQQLIAPYEIANVFMNIEDVYSCHIDLLGRLEKAGEDWPFVVGVGKIFLAIKSLLKAYDAYVGNFKNAINEVQRLRANNQKFEQFLLETEEDEDLQTLLSLPVNRISQYEYLVDALANNEPTDSPEHEDLLGAFSVLQQSSKVVQRSLTESTETAKLMGIQRQLKADGPLSLAQPGRKFVQNVIGKKACAFLFSDLLILCKHSADKKFAARVGGGGAVYKVKRMVDIGDVEVEASGDNILDVITKDAEPFKLTLSDTEERDRWMRDIRHLTEEKQRSRMFGTALLETVIREERPSGVPFMLERMAEVISSPPAVHEVGLFRVPGKTSEREHLIEVCNKGGEEAMKFDLKALNIMTVCDVFKLYFRMLPEPLLSFDLYPHLVAVGRSGEPEEEKVRQLKELLASWVPPFAIKVLKFLLEFLVKVASYSDENKMTSSNLSIIFGPGLMWTASNSLESAVDMPYVNSVCQLLIEYHETLL